MEIFKKCLSLKIMIVREHQIWNYKNYKYTFLGRDFIVLLGLNSKQ